MLAFALLLTAPPLHAQGCTQCLDNTAATPPATRRAYRHAIILLTLTAGGLFATTLILFKRHR
ncbi:MAG TPA: copper resistance protein CopC [Edaphobacter sp.]|nr:copper resistance protein CopC [Edaphobacter sp.]